MSISSSFPSISPSLNLDFAKSKSLDPRITFTRAQTGNIATYTGSDGLIKYAGPNAPRFDHKQTFRTNLITYSEDFNTSWTKQRVNVTVNDIVAPDGSTTADKIQGNGQTGGAMSVYQTITSVEPSASYTISVFAKAGDAKWLAIEAYDGTSNDETFFNLENGTIGIVGNDMSSPSIKNYGNGWYRCSVVRTIGAGANQVRPQYTLAIGDGVISVLDTKYFYLWGAQIEGGDTPTAYIATGPSAVTRTATESLGLLVEESRTNLNIQSSFTPGYSRIGFSSVTKDAIGPDGQDNTATTLTEISGSNSGQYVVYADFNVANNNQVFTHSVFVKAALRDEFQLNIHNIGTAGNTTSINAIYNTTIEDFTTAEMGGPSATALIGYGVVKYPNGWYRIWASGNVGNSDQTTTNLRFHVRTLENNGSYIGSGQIAGYIYGGQIELGSFPTSYIPTSGSSVTRPADALSITGSENFSSFYNSTQWTLLVDQVVSKQTFLSSSATTHEHVFDDSSSSNQYKIRFVSNTTNPYIDTYAQTNSAVVLDAPGDYTLWTNETVDVPLRSAFTCNQTTSKFCNNGGSVQIDKTFSLSSGVNRFRITSLRAGNVSKISYYPVALPSTQLQTLTAPKV